MIIIKVTMKIKINFSKFKKKKFEGKKYLLIILHLGYSSFYCIDVVYFY